METVTEQLSGEPVWGLGIGGWTRAYSAELSAMQTPKITSFQSVTVEKGE
jgi:hypothetical protein